MTFLLLLVMYSLPERMFAHVPGTVLLLLVDVTAILDFAAILVLFFSR